MGGDEESILMLQGWGGKAQPGTQTISIRLAPLRRAGVGMSAHWVQAAQGIWLELHGHADKKEMHTQINLYTKAQTAYEGAFVHTQIHKTNFLFDKTNRIYQDG